MRHPGRLSLAIAEAGFILGTMTGLLYDQSDERRLMLGNNRFLTDVSVYLSHSLLVVQSPTCLRIVQERLLPTKIIRSSEPGLEEPFE